MPSLQCGWLAGITNHLPTIILHFPMPFSLPASLSNTPHDAQFIVEISSLVVNNEGKGRFQNFLLVMNNGVFHKLHEIGQI